MPRAISVRRKYLPALSIEDSWPSSHRFTVGRRNPCGGGPAGVAARRVEVVKVADGDVLRAARTLVRGETVGRARASAVRDLAEAMVMGVMLVASCEERRMSGVGGVIEMARALIGWSGKITSAKCLMREKSELRTSLPKFRKYSSSLHLNQQDLQYDPRRSIPVCSVRFEVCDKDTAANIASNCTLPLRPIHP